MSITYLVFDENMELVAIFALTHKVIQIVNEGLSKSATKKIKRFSQLDEESNTYTISAFLIAQFGKNSNYIGDARLTGNHLMELTEAVLKEAQKIIGGGTAYLECEDEEKLLNFYQNDSNGYRVFNERYSKKDNIKYIQLFKLI